MSMSVHAIDAYSMLPGIAMAGYFMSYTSVTTWPTFMAYVLMCLVSMKYHFKKNDPACDDETLRRCFKHDTLAQQMALCCLVAYSPYGGAMVMLLLPFATIIALANADVTENSESALVYGASFLNCILAALSLDSSQRMYMMMEMVGVYIVFNIDKFYKKNKFTHGIFHLLVHHVTYTAWSLIGVI